MNNDRKEVEQKTEESKQQAMKEAHTDHRHNDGTIHTVNPFTGTEVNITPEDLEGIEKKLEADRERDLDSQP